MKYAIYIMICSSLLLLSCINGKKQTTNYSYKAISEEKLDGDVEYTFSNDSSYVLAFVERKGTAKQPQNLINFIVHDLKAEKVVYEDAVENGSVSFYNEHALKIITIPGIMKEGHTIADHTTIYDLRTNEKKKLTDQ